MICSGVNLSADVCKVGHHGSSTSTTPTFLDKVHPTYAIISSGKKNKYGHPHAKTMSRLKRAGVKMYRTDTQGTITASSNGRTITIRTER